MGGYGSGNWRKKKKTTGDFPSIDIRALQRVGCLNAGFSHSSELIHDTYTESVIIRTESDNTLMITYRCGNNRENHAAYKFKIEWMPCNYGSKRAFFLCPSCERRVALLYCVNHFACRHCHNLAYECQGEKTEDRNARQANKIRTKLGWKFGILNGMGDKPKGMHIKTFEQLINTETWYGSKVLDSMCKALNIVFSRSSSDSIGQSK